uniref:Uncharacterized protein n=1 Tax=Glossina pallidipes TaxID=7398 RepID=A0A1A9ZJZ7_GLOPL
MSRNAMPKERNKFSINIRVNLPSTPETLHTLQHIGSSSSSSSIVVVVVSGGSSSSSSGNGSNSDCVTNSDSTWDSLSTIEEN